MAIGLGGAGGTRPFCHSQAALFLACVPFPAVEPATHLVLIGRHSALAGVQAASCEVVAVEREEFLTRTVTVPGFCSLERRVSLYE